MSAVIKDAAQQNDQPLVSLRNLNKYYGEFAAVDNIALDIKDGEFLTFLGSSGSGKSTTLSMLAGFETPTSGEILVEGKSLVNVPPHKRDIGMVFQRYSLFPHLSVRDNIAFPLAIRKLDSAERERRVDAMLSWCNWSNSPIAALRNCLEASSNGSPSPGRWSMNPASC